MYACPARRLILADASALVAALDEADRNHSRCAELLSGIRDADLLTSCAAFAEAMCLLGSRHGWPGTRALWDLVERGILSIAPEPRDWFRVARLMAKYRDTPMALADAQLMTLADDLKDPSIFTFDSDFTIYRFAGRLSANVGALTKPKRCPFRGGTSRRCAGRG